MNVLAIGNSFSTDATRYLHDIAVAGGDKLEIVNLYIGGCSQERHYRNMLGDKKDYLLECNGHQTGFYVTMQEALLNREWDVITLQQASHFSAKKETYVPYITELADYVRRCQPHAKILIHETWAYEAESLRLFNVAKYPTPEAMLADVKEAYRAAAELIHADGMIPSGEMFMDLLARGIPKVHRDTFHASLGLGRYALGLLWYRCLTGKSVLDNSYNVFDVPVAEEDIAIVKACVESFEPIFHS